MPTNPTRNSTTARPDQARSRIALLLEEYFVARDQGWVQPAVEAASRELEHGRLGPRPAEFAASTADVARQVAGQRGLAATSVQTAFSDDRRIDIRGTTAMAKIHVATSVRWNQESLVESSFSDHYIARLDGSGDRWALADVTYAPIPSTGRPRRRHHRGRKPRENHGRRPHAPTEAGKTAGEQLDGLAAAKQFDRGAAAGYARQWSKTSVIFNGDLIVGDVYNPEYADAKQDNDCTNFASQTLHAGGWPFAGGVNPNDRNNWTPNLSGPFGSSKTWSRAEWLYEYASSHGRGVKQRVWPPEGEENLDIWNLQPGDLIFPDWDPDLHYDGTVDHAMVVAGSFTELGFTEPTYCQHSPHRRDLPLSVGMSIATAPPPPVKPEDGMGGQGRAVKWYPVHINDSFQT